MNRAEMIMPGVIQITSDGPASTDNVDEWAREMYREIGLDPDRQLEESTRFTEEGLK